MPAHAPYADPVEPDDEAVLAERDVVDDYVLRRRRLRGALARGGPWRLRPERGTLTYLVVGAVLAIVAVLIVGMIAFVRTQIALRGHSSPSRPAAVATLHLGTGGHSWAPSN